MPNAVYTETLRRAARAVGGEMQLARALKVSGPQAHRWVAGEEQPTTAMYHKALDLLIAIGAN